MIESYDLQYSSYKLCVNLTYLNWICSFNKICYNLYYKLYLI